MLFRVLDCVFAICLLAGCALPFFSEQPVVTVGVWVLVFLAWAASSERRRGTDAPNPCSAAVLFPAILIFQRLLDRHVPYLGSALILFGNLAVIASLVRGNPFPTARLSRVIRSRR